MIVPPQVTSVSGKPLTIAFEEIAGAKTTYHRTDPESDEEGADAEGAAAEGADVKGVAAEELTLTAVADVDRLTPTPMPALQMRTPVTGASATGASVTGASVTGDDISEAPVSPEAVEPPAPTG